MEGGFYALLCFPLLPSFLRVRGKDEVLRLAVWHHIVRR